LVLFFGSGAAVVAAEKPVPNFTLAPATGAGAKPFRLADAKGHYVALHFLLKTECPFCLRHTHEYSSKAEEMPNVVQVFIKPDTMEEIQKWVADLPKNDRSPEPIYQDPGAILADRLNLPGDYKFHGETMHYPALVLINPEGKEVFRYVGKSNTDRYPLAKLKEKVAQLARQ